MTNAFRRIHKRKHKGSGSVIFCRRPFRPGVSYIFRAHIIFTSLLPKYSVNDIRK